MKIPTVKFSKKVVIILVSVGALLAAISGTSAYAAKSNALPGSALYPFKKAWEDIALFVAPTAEIKAQTYLNIAQNRIDAVKQSPTNTKTPVIQQAQVHLQNALTEANKVSDSKTRQEIKDSISEKTSEAEAEIESEAESSDSSTDQQNTQDAKDQNAQIQTEASKND
jgi:hypothetical protein